MTNNNIFDTIAAISTGNTNQAISIIRISGPNAFKIIKKISCITLFNKNTLSLSFIKNNDGELIDKVIIGIYKNPNSYTGENIVEINAHGGVIVTQQILKLCLINGARLAEPGEFSKRAFINGKINLIEAQGINNLIHAQSISQAKIAVNNLEGRPSKIIQKLRKDISKIIGIIETNIDYPEYDDVEVLTTETLLPKLLLIQEKIKQVIKSSILTHKLYEGIKIAIIGKTNAGKSTLLNNILNESKAIVSPLPGTTRDVVEGNIEIEGVLYHFFDTAGIRNSKNKIENLGIEKTMEKIKSSDLVLYIQEPYETDDQEYKQLLKGKEYIKINSKSDIKRYPGVSIDKNNIEELLLQLKLKFSKLTTNNNDILISTRQQSLLEKSLIYIEDAIVGLNNKLSPDTIIIDINNAWNEVSGILGQVYQDDLLTDMFSNFCLGK